MTLIRPQVGLAFAFVSAENPPGTTSGKGKGGEKKKIEAAMMENITSQKIAR